MTSKQEIASLLLRFAIATGFLSAVASRLGFWGNKSSGWKSFVNYTAQTNSFLPTKWASNTAIITTIAELTIGILLLVGYQIQITSLAAAMLTLLFAIAMSISFGIKEPLDYSVFGFSAACFLLSTMPNQIWSIDKFLNQ